MILVGSILFTLLLFSGSVADTQGSVFVDCRHLKAGDVVKLFSRPTNGKLVATLPCDSSALVLGGDSDWMIVETANGTVGYVNAQFISEAQTAKDKRKVLGKKEISFPEIVVH